MYTEVYISFVYFGFEKDNATPLHSGHLSTVDTFQQSEWCPL
jgi:hypothetical protein